MSIWDKINNNLKKAMEKERPNNTVKRAANNIFGNITGSKPFEYKTNLDPSMGNPRKGLPFAKLVNDAINNDHR